ncbi:hypothetical protein HDU86_006382 [Geranomyces michiganensis]|nr:hypothetical protein HDU86_006382 [Geranomyces michiganensis]
MSSAFNAQRASSHSNQGSLVLIDYLSQLPAPALILKAAQSFSHEAVVHVNQALYKLTKISNAKLRKAGSAQALVDVEGSPLADILRVDNPNDMEDWLSHALHVGASSRTFRTGLVAGKEGDADLLLIEVDWTAVVMQAEYVVLTGIVVSQPPPSSASDDDLVLAASPQKPPSKLEPRAQLHRGATWADIDRLVDALSGGGIMGEMLRNFDWAKTPLGSITTWPQSLLTALSLMLGSPSPMSIWWGPQYVLLYNDAYIPVTFGKHPWIYGKPGSEGWSEVRTIAVFGAPYIWHDLLPAAEKAMAGGGVYHENDILFMTRRGYPEETYHTWAYVPIRQEDGSVGGLLNPTYESTPQVLLARRMKTLRDYSALAGQAKTVTDLLAVAREILTAASKDISFAMIYSGSFEYGEAASTVSEVMSDPDGHANHPYVLTLREVVGIPRGHRAAPESVTVDLSSKLKSPHPWPFQEVCRQRTAIVVHDQALVGGITGRGYGDPSRDVIICPITASDADEVRGVMIIGLSGRLFLDEDLRSFVDLLTRQTASSLSMVVAFEEEVKRAEALAAIDRTKTAFFSSVSHELRTPLTLILGPLEELINNRQAPPSAMQLERLSLVNRNAKRLLKLVNSLLDFSRLEAGRMQASFKETDVAAFTRDLASVFRSAIEKGGVSYFVECDKERRVYIDQDMWEKIVFNLIGNAFKFTMKGQIKVSVKQSSDRSGIVFSVEDTGSGIPAHEVGKVFERFHQVEGQTGRSHEGSGIGLALTDELVKLHGGTVNVRSELGKGSVFSVTIPYGCAHLPPDMVSSEPCTSGFEGVSAAPRVYGAAVVEEARHWLAGSSTEDDSTDSGSIGESTDSSMLPGRSFPMTTRGRKILLADDNADMRKYVQMFLRSWWTVVEAINGQQAWEMILDDPPDIIVSDVMMPVLDGFGLLKAVRAHPVHKSIPLILLSARAGEEARVDGLRAGADDYLVKPFSAKELVARVHSHLEMSRLRVELEQRVKERTNELAESEWRYKALATMSPVGIYRTNKLGYLTFANDKWWEISMHDRGADPMGKRFLESVHDDDRERVQDEWRIALSSASHTMEIKWCDRETGTVHHSLSETILETDNDGNVVGMIGCLTDFTERMRLEREKMDALEVAEKYQRRRAEEAENVRRQQELFIDMTAHELRNPLNGIYHNADLIHESLEKVHEEVNGLRRKYSHISGGTLDQGFEQALARVDTDILQSIEAIETINQCAQHQKNIADDVLQVSKISMNLLRLSHVDYQPRNEIQSIVRMFQSEANAKDILLTLDVSPSYDQLHVNWVRGDPKRLAQVLINLLSNAVRFTERMDVRTVSVLVEASVSPPSLPQRPFTDSSSSRSGSVQGSEDGEGFEGRTDGIWGRMSPSISSSNSDSQIFRQPRSLVSNSSVFDLNGTHRKPVRGAPVYISVTIADSGCGMTPEERALIFRRFINTPKTYGEFGGSGLGLFISKRLIELQGGQIGVDSTEGLGSTFKFYIKVEMRDTPPPAGSVNTDSDKSTRSSIGKLTRRRSSHADGPYTIPNAPVDELALGGLSSPVELPKPPKIFVLIVEDNVVNQKVLKRQLETAGYDTRIANHGGEALAILSSDPPPAEQLFFDIVLMDIEMPVMDGLECASRIRTGEPNLPTLDHTLPGKIPIIAVTGNARQEYMKKAMDVGMDDFMVKPYVKKDLIAKIESLVGRRRSRTAKV